MRMRAADFLQAITGGQQSEGRLPVPSSDRPFRLAVIDSAYNSAGYPGTLPKVTYEGETTMSERGLSVAGMYHPIPGERVVVAPIGTTYVILGPVGSATPRIGNSAVDAAHIGFGTGEALTLAVFDYTFLPGWAYEVAFKGMVYGTAGSQMHFRLRKTNASGADWGEYGRFRLEGPNLGQASYAGGSLFLLRNASTPLVATVGLTASVNSGTGNFHASPTSPRWLTVRPVGSVKTFAGMGVEVS